MDDALSIHRCGDCPGYVLAAFDKVGISVTRIADHVAFAVEQTRG